MVNHLEILLHTLNHVSGLQQVLYWLWLVSAATPPTVQFFSTVNSCDDSG
jgi:hypothetical protein